MTENNNKNISQFFVFVNKSILCYLHEMTFLVSSLPYFVGGSDSDGDGVSCRYVLCRRKLPLFLFENMLFLFSLVLEHLVASHKNGWG